MEIQQFAVAGEEVLTGAVSAPIMDGKEPIKSS
jgi:hypothetical protein